MEKNSKTRIDFDQTVAIILHKKNWMWSRPQTPSEEQELTEGTPKAKESSQN
jgi:hypothetical protein